MLKGMYAVTDAIRVTEGYPGKGNKDKSVKKTLKSNLKLIGIFSDTTMVLKKGLGGEKKMEQIKNKMSVLKVFTFLFLCATLTFLCVCGAASAATIYVPDDYATIQQAVDNATAGDTIIVRDGTYYENVDIYKRLTIRSENGSANCVVHAANSNDYVFNVSANNVTIKGFTVTGATGFGKAGIYLYKSNNCRIENVNASNNYDGIELSSSSNNTIANNTVLDNWWDGILLKYSGNNILANNIVLDNYHGIHLKYSGNSTIANNTASNGYDGIRLYYSDNNTIANNTASNNWDGIYLEYSSSNIIANNNISSNNDDGIELRYSSNNTIANNNISSNYYGDGIHLEYSSSNNIMANNTVSDSKYGIHLDHSSNNIMANNSMTDNTYNFCLYGEQDFHFDNNIDTTNTVDGKPIYYIKNASNTVYDSSTNAGVFYCIWCNNVTVKDLTLTKNGYGVFFWKTNNSKIINNTPRTTGGMESTSTNPATTP